MRLTLRTLLAYRDRVLSESDLNDLHKRIQQSEMAGNLLRRMEALNKHPQLLAPKVDARGLGGDANSVAEYLDDILQGEKVPELERVCLESDVQLAELTQCHELLSTALNTPVDVPDELRERIVGLLDLKQRAIESKKLVAYPVDSTGDNLEAINVGKGAIEPSAGRRKRVDPTHIRPNSHENQKQQDERTKSVASRSVGHAMAVTTAQPVQSPMVASGGQSIRPTGLDLEGSQLVHEVPEYLRGRTRDGWRGPLAIGALAAALALLVWHSLGPWKGVQQMFAARTTANQAANPNAQIATSDNAEEAEGESNEKQPVAVSATGEQPGLPDERDRENNRIGTQPRPAPVVDSSNTSISTTPESNSNSSKTPEPAPSELLGTVQPDGPNAIAPGASAPSAIEWLPADVQEKRAVILATSPGLAGARRLAAAEALPSGTQVIVPPATRPILDLARQLRWTVCGPTKMVVKHNPSDVTLPPTVELTLGRALIASGPNAREVELVTAGWKGRISLGDPSSMAAIELSYRPVAVGSVIDPRAFQSVLTIVSVEGTMTVTPLSAQGNPVEQVPLKIGEGVGIVGAALPQRFVLKEVPAWYRAIAERPIDIQAADDLHRYLINNPKTHEILTGLLMSRRPETAAIAAQTMAMLGHWDGLAGPASVLNNVEARSHWTTTLDLVRQLLASEPEQAAQLRAALASAEPRRGNLLCDLILGLPEDQLTAGALEALVGLLESEFLSERVLAGYQLKLIAGKDMGYQANDVDRTVVQQWRRELANKRVRILPPNPPLWEAK